MSYFPPPPRRVAAPSTPPPAPKTLWGRASATAGNAWGGLYRVADSVGGWTNAQTAKIGTESFYPTSLDVECNKAARILRAFTMDAAELPQESLMDMKKRQKVIKKIPSSVVANCRGLAIFTVFRTGFLVSGATGSGVVMARLPDGNWSAPSGVLLHTIGVGFLAGADIYDVVLILRTEAAVESFTRPRVTLGGEMSIAAGPVGNGFTIESGANLAPVWAYVKSKGLFAGVQVNGQILIERNDENARSYGVLVTAAEILDGDVRPPYWCEGLHETIRAAEGKDYRTSLIPLGASPSDNLSARRLPPEELDSDDLAARAEMEEAMRSFGIEDPTINASRRAEDPLLLTGQDLELLSTPALSAGSPALESASSSIYPLSLDGSASPSRLGLPPPPLPKRAGGEKRGSREFIAGERLEEVVECPPGEEGRRSLEKPVVPPRRSPRVGVESPKMEQEDRVEEEKREGEVKEESGEDKEAVDEGKDKWEEAEEKKEQVAA